MFLMFQFFCTETFPEVNREDEEGSSVDPSPFLIPSGGSNGVEEIEECKVESDGSRLFTFDSKTWTRSVNVVIAVGVGSSANDTFERVDSVGRLCNAINRFFNVLHHWTKSIFHDLDLFLRGR